MEFGTILGWSAGDRTGFVQRLREVEQLGYSFAGVGDSGDLYTALTVAALAPTALSLGPQVSVPLGRHPALVARELASLQELSGGRIRFAIGRGVSTVASMGSPAATFAELKSYVIALRAILGGEATEWQRTSVPGLSAAVHVPVYMSAYGPSVRRLAGEIADGVVLGSGSSPGMVGRFLEDVEAGAARSGRSLSDLDVWVMSRVGVREDREEALADVRMPVVQAGRSHLRVPAQFDAVPAALKPLVQELLQTGKAEDPDLIAYLTERFALVGTAEECLSQVGALAALGVSRVLFPAMFGPEGLVERFAHAVIKT